MTPENRKIDWYETCLSLVILLVLTVIGSAVFQRQYRFNPAVLQTLSDRSDAPGQEQSTPVRSVESLIRLKQDISPLTPPETFTPENLSDKIDGKAELYLSAGFKRLDSQRFADHRTPERWMEIFIYDMGAHENAFAVYSNQQRDDALPAGLGRLSYTTGNALFLVHGPYYIEFIASEAATETIQIMRDLVEVYIGGTPVKSEPLTGRKLFPADGLDADSITLIPADAFGYSGFDRVFVAQYSLGDDALTVFVSRRESPEAAARLANDYHAFLTRFGGNDAVPEGKPVPENTHIVEILGSYEVFFTHGASLAGVHEAADPDQALELIGMLNAHLKDAPRGK